MPSQALPRQPLQPLSSTADPPPALEPASARPVVPALASVPAVTGDFDSFRAENGQGNFDDVMTIWGPVLLGVLGSCGPIMAT